MKQIISTIAIAGMAVMASCSTGGDKAQQAVVQAQQATIDSMKMVMTRQQLIDSMNEVAEAKMAAVKTIPAVKRRSSGGGPAGWHIHRLQAIPETQPGTRSLIPSP